MKKYISVLFVCCLLAILSGQEHVIKIACIGNSITEGLGRDNPDSYPNQLNELLGPKYDVRNYGIGGRTLLKNGDFPYWDETFFEVALDFEPDIVIILLGTNDSKPQNWIFKDEFYTDYTDLVAVFNDVDSKPDIFVGYPPPVFQDGFGINDTIIHYQIIPLIDSVRNTLKTFHINFYDNMIGMGDPLFPDGIHPNASGYGEMAKIAADAILNRPSGVISYFYANPTVIEETESTMLYWEVSDGSDVSLNGESVAINDSLEVLPTQTMEYTLIASGEYNDTSKIQITYLPSGIIKSFMANPPVLEKGTNDSTLLKWETTINSQVKLDTENAEQSDSMIVCMEETSTFTLTAEGAVKDTANVTVRVLDADQINRSLLAKNFSASSTEYSYTINAAFDNDTSTYWLSSGHSAEWLSVDLGKELYINRIRLHWGAVYAASYRVEIIDETNTLSVFTYNSAGNGGIEDFSRDPLKGRQIRVLCLKSSSNADGYEIKEFEIYGSSKSGTNAIELNINEPEKFSLSQNYPNPFNPVTTIEYYLRSASHVNLSVFNLNGQLIKRLVSQKQPAGKYVTNWDASDDASGLYVLKLSTDQGVSQAKKIILIK